MKYSSQVMFFSFQTKNPLATRNLVLYFMEPQNQTVCGLCASKVFVTYSWRGCSRNWNLLLLCFRSWFSASGKRLPSSDPSGFRWQRGFWDFDFCSPCSEVFLIRKHQPEMDTKTHNLLNNLCVLLGIPWSGGACWSLCLTFRSVSWCKWQRWCCQDILLAHYKPLSRDGPLSPVTHKYEYQQP